MTHATTRAGITLGLGLAAAAALAAPLPAQSKDANQADRRRATGQVHRTIRRAGRGPLPRAVHGVRVGTTTAAVAGRGVGIGAGPRAGAFGRPARSRDGLGGGRRGLGGTRGIGIRHGLPHHLVHGPMVSNHRTGFGLRGIVVVGPPWLAAAELVAGGARAVDRPRGIRYAPPPPRPLGLPQPAPAPRGTCATATIRPHGGADRTLRIATGHLGAETPSEAEAILTARVRRGEPIVLRGWDGPGLIIPGERVREVSAAPCAGEGAREGAR